MPKLPTDMTAARAHAEKQRQAREAAEAKRQASAEHDRQLIRDFANELRAKAGQPPLAPDEPVMGFFCRRGKRT